MELVKCSKGHFYDASKHTTCPHCSDGDNIGVTAPLTSGEIQTGAPVTGRRVEEPREPMSEVSQLENEIKAISKSTDNEVKTVAFYSKKTGNDPVTGWLVCIEGAQYGNSYSLKSGRNFIGRGYDMDICIEGDNTISRSKHAIVIYDPKNNSFLLQPGETRELVYLNEAGVYTVSPLNAYDVIQLGETKVLFMPLCSDKFNWKSEVKGE